jgi:hypothetical protein
MSDSSEVRLFFIGWDVGGWNCDRNPTSRDAIVILDEALSLVGRPWRGNLRSVINGAGSTSAWVQSLFALCKTNQPGESAAITLAIDTPLGFSNAFLDLATGLKAADAPNDSNTNPYLFRETELTLFRRGLSPLSAIKDMIGSQATKGMHVLARFAPHRVGCGIWTDGAGLTALEAYPSACKGSPTINGLRQRFSAFDHEDKEDALTCALIAYLFATQRDVLVAPAPHVPEREGWIWVPQDAFHAAPSDEALESRPL